MRQVYKIKNHCRFQLVAYKGEKICSFYRCSFRHYFEVRFVPVFQRTNAQEKLR